MRNNLKIILLLMSSLSGSCVMMSSSEVSVKETVKLDKGAKRVTFLNNTPYLADMSIALSEYGFDVMPMPSQQQIIEIKTDTKLSKYNEAATRWRLTFTTQHSGMSCAFTDFNIHHFTLMLTDITNNKVLDSSTKRMSNQINITMREG